MAARFAAREVQQPLSGYQPTHGTPQHQLVLGERVEDPVPRYCWTGARKCCPRSSADRAPGVSHGAVWTAQRRAADSAPAAGLAVRDETGDESDDQRCSHANSKKTHGVDLNSVAAAGSRLPANPGANRCSDRGSPIKRNII